MEGFLCDSHHCQSTLVGKTESYNELFKNAARTKFCRAFTCRNANKLDYVNDEKVEVEEEEDAINACPQFKKTFFWESNRISLASAVWTWLAISEAEERNILEATFFGPKIGADGKKITFKDSLHMFMNEVNNQR